MALIIYPLDNMEYSAAEVGSYACTRTRGVYSAERNLEVTAAGGMQVQVADGIAWLQASKYWGVSVVVTEPVTLRLNVSDGGKSRVDAVCLRLNKTENKPELVVRTGAASGSPVIPEIRHDSSYDEIYLASVMVKAGAIGITSADITDLRLDERYCGLMRDGVTRIPTQALLEQAQAEWNHWFTDVRQQLERDPAGQLAQQIASLQQTIQSQAETIGQLTTSLNTLQNGLSNYVTKQDAADFAVVQSFAAGHLVTDTYGNKQAKG